MYADGFGFFLASSGVWGVRGSDPQFNKFCSSMDSGSQGPGLMAGNQEGSHPEGCAAGTGGKCTDAMLIHCTGLERC